MLKIFEKRKFSEMDTNLESDIQERFFVLVKIIDASFEQVFEISCSRQNVDITLRYEMLRYLLKCRLFAHFLKKIIYNILFPNLRNNSRLIVTFV